MLTIRQACPEDAPQLSAMGYASYHHHFAHLWRDADELALFLKQEYAEDALRRSLADATQHWLIAEKTAGESWLWLEVLAANPAARRFYERQGMQHIRDTTFHSASQQSILHILAKPI
ncbi:MAG: hypothetical protein E7B66_10205 [Klebsiella pneumoniae]|nr:hypothetical protein [Klebsiella pneumoniae]